MHARSLARSSLLLALSAACSAPPATRPAPAPPAKAPETAQAPSRWRSVAGPPRDDREHPGVDLPSGRLVVDASGARWLFPLEEGKRPDEAPARPRSRELVDEGRLLARYVDPKLGFLALAADGRLLGSVDPLGALETVATLPADTQPGSLRFFRGGITFAGPAGPAVIGPDGSRRAIRPMPGHTLAEALLGEDGVGVGLFLPEAVAVTRDGGSTWTPVDLAGVRVQRLHDQQGTALLLPGGVRDGFARAVDLVTGKLTRAIERQTPSERRARRRERRSRDLSRGFGEPFEGFELDFGARVPWRHERLVPQLALSGQRGAPVVGDGERVLSFFPDENDGSRLVMSRGRIGEALASFGGGALGQCVLLGAALCGDQAAVLCGAKAHLFRGEEPPVTRLVPLGTQVGFDHEGRFVMVTADEAAGTVSIRRFGHDDDEPTPEPVPGVTRGPFTLLGGCGAPAFWVHGGGAAVRWSPERRAFDPPVELSPEATPIAVSHERSLVASNGVDLLFFPEETRAPLGPHQAGYVGFARGGKHALYVAPSGQVQQSDDGGRSFSPIATPATRGRQPVLCGDQRCQLGEGAWREGFVRDHEAIAAWPDPPRADRPQPRPEQKAPPPSPDLPAALRCQVDEALFAGVSGEALLPRVGPWLFAGASKDDRGGYAATFGDPAGKVSLAKLSPAPPRARGEVQVGAGMAVTTSWSLYRQSQTGVFRWEPQAAPTKIDALPFGDPSFLAEEGFAQVDDAAGELVLWGKQRTQRRAYRTRPGSEGTGVLHVEADGAWIAGAMVGRGQLRIVVMTEGGRSEERELSVNPADTPEQAVGFLPGPTRRIVLLEPTTDGGTVLRIRPVSATFDLGEPIEIPNTRTASGLVSLASCDAAAKGGLVHARSFGARTVEVGGRRTQHEIVRLLRASELGACVERTLAPSGAGGTTAGLVIAGNGGVGMSSSVGGVRCGPLDARPLPPSPSVP